jgi:membrane-bound lytic murein transglycosylase A
MRIGYDAQNGRDYVAIGKLLRDRGALAPGQATMDGIIGWLRAHPDEAPAVLNANASYIFFREITGDGPIGALGQALTPQVSVAADPRYLPLGAPLWLDTRVPAPFARLMVAQDTGGAIKGPNRLDIFWGAGAAARATAGGLSTTGTMVLLLPPAAAARLTGDGPQARR